MNSVKKYINKSIAILLTVVAITLQCNVVIFADENTGNPPIGTTEEQTLNSLSTETKADTNAVIASSNDASYEKNDTDIEEDGESNIEEEDDLDIPIDILRENEGKDFVPEELLVSIRGGEDGLYLTLDEDRDTSFLDELSFEPLAVISDKYDTSDENNAISSDEMLECAKEELGEVLEIDIFEDVYEGEVGVDEYEVYKVIAPGYDTKAKLNSLIKKFERLPAVQYAELNEVITVDSLGDYTNRQWGNDGSSSECQTGVMDPAYAEPDKLVNWNYYDAGNNPAPKIQTTSNDPVVVVMDTGIDYNHPDLDGVIWTDNIGLDGGTHGYDAYYGKGYEPMDGHGHGTHVAGIIASEWNNKGTSGVTSGVKLMGVKIADQNGRVSVSGTIYGYNYINSAQDNGVNIVSINCSWGGDYTGDMLNQFVTRAGTKGAVSCFSSGNDSLDMDKKLNSSGGLSSNPYVVIVNAVDDRGELAEFSNYGLKTTDVAAPGVNIYSTINTANAKADACADDNVPVDLTAGGKAITDFDTSNPYFTYLKSGCTITNVSGVGINGSNCIKLHSDVPTPAGMRMKLDFTDTSFSETPTAFTLAYKCPKVKDIVSAYVCIRNANTNSLIGYESSSTSNEWMCCTVNLTQAMLDDKIIIQVYCADSNRQLITSGFDCYIDRIMFTEDTCSYVMMDGTSMATPFVTAEAAILSEYFYQNQSKAERAKNICARIKGSVNLLKNTKDRQRLESGGMIRVDKAVRGETVPVINDIVITKAGDKYKADLNGYFFDGNAALGESDENFVGLSIDGINIDSGSIISQTANTISFYISDEKITNEHKFSVTSTKGTGYKFLECKVTDITAKDRFVELPIAQTSSCTELVAGIPLSMKAYNGKMYLLSGNSRTGKLSLWQQDIPNTISGVNVAGDWNKISNVSFLFTGRDCHSMAIVNGKIVGTGKAYSKSVGYIWFIWEYDISTGDVLIKQYSTTLYYNSGVFYTGGKLFLVMGEDTSTTDASGNTINKYRTHYYELTTDGNYTLRKGIYIEGSTVKQCAEILFDGKDYYAVCGKKYSEGNTYSVEKLILDDKGIANITSVNTNVLSGIDNLFNTDYAMVTSVSSDGEKMLFTGPAIAYGDYIEADTYVLTDVTKNAVPVSKFVSTASLQNVCTTIDGNNYYVIANNANSENGWIYAYTDITSLKEYKHKEEKGSSSSGSNANLVTPIYPAYVEKSGKWSKIVLANGKTIWKFTDSKGNICVNKWVAIPDEEGRSGGPFGWYRFDAAGNMITGWYTDERSRRFYLDPTEGNHQGKMLTGWLLIDGKWYYFKETGKDDFGTLVPDKVRG